MTNAIPLPESAGGPSPVDKLLGLVSRVQGGEGAGALLLALNVFLLLGTYYILKVLREPLILGQPGGAEVKSYATAGQALLFLLVVPIYGWVAAKFSRVGLVGGVTVFFVSNLLVFFLLGNAGVPIGVPFYLWLGVYNMLVVAQFWAFANDLYSEEQGKRLFPVVGVGASLGAWAGAVATKPLFNALGVFPLMALSAGLLCLCAALTVVIHRRAMRDGTMREASAPLDRKGGFQLVLKERYLLLMALLMLVFTCVNSNGEYIVGRFVSGLAQALPGAERGKFIGGFYSDYYGWVNLLGFLIQMLAVSRILRWLGVRGALFVLPLIAMGGYAIFAVAPVLGLVRVTKILENSTDYSLHNTVRHALFLPTSREAKYKAKAATDTFFVRAGDFLSAGVVLVFAQILGLGIRSFAAVNLVLVGVWLLIAVGIHRQHKRLSAE